MLSGLKDVDREILSNVSDKELLTVCSLNKKFYHDVCDDNLLLRRLSKYPGIEQYKEKNETWKRFFLNVIYYVSKMKEKHDFDYTEGDFRKQYDLLSSIDKNHLLRNAAYYGYLDLVKYSLNKGADIHYSEDAALRYASDRGHLQIVKYLIDKGANINANHGYSIRWASRIGYFDIVKFLIEKGANIHLNKDDALLGAIIEGHVDIVKYLVEHGVYSDSVNDIALRYALKNGHTEIVNYLKNI